MPNQPTTRVLPGKHMFTLALAAALCACGAPANLSSPDGQSVQALRPLPVTYLAPSPTPLPSATPIPTPTPIPIRTVWIDPALPDSARQILMNDVNTLIEQRPDGSIIRISEDRNADLRLRAGRPGDAIAGAPVLTRVLAVVAPFPTVPDSIAFDALTALWAGDAGALPEFSAPDAPTTLFIDADTQAALTLLLGPAGSAAPVRVVDEPALIDAAWEARPAAIAIVPFDRLDPRWKLLWLDTGDATSMNLFDKRLDAAAYPLTLRVIAEGDATLASHLPQTTNRDVNKLAVVAMTGVTAMVRGTAVQMERKGITYPAEAIVDWLVTADVTHISNEVSFWEDCPFPTFDDGVSMCSNPKYIELLKYVGTDIIELSGNHLWDKGWIHLSTTLQMYDDLSWPYFAGGRNFEEALRPVTMTVNGNRLAFIGCNWFGADWATDTLPGSARCGSNSPRDLDLITPIIRELAAEGYLVIATLQYEEYYFYQPTPQQARDFAALRDAGAVVVNGSQGHHAQGFNVTAQGFIRYGTGNLFFGDQFEYGAHQTMVDRHAFYDGRYLGVDVRTAFIEDYSKPVPMTPEARAEFLRTLIQASGY